MKIKETLITLCALTLLAALAYAGTTLLARWAVPRYGSSRVLFLELAGGTATDITPGVSGFSS